MSVDRQLPEIRFEGFNGEWNSLILGENAKFTKGQGYSKGDLVESGSPIILYGRLYTNYQTVITNVDTFVTEKDKSTKSIGGEVIVPASGESSEDISRAAVVRMKNVILGGDLNIVLPNKNIHSIFLALVLSNGRVKKELSSKAQGKSVVHIRNSDLSDLNIIVPSEDIEQTQIGNYFQKLDNLINQHQKKHDKLCNIKKAMLEKMFPKQGKIIPEIRFRGFSGEWENKGIEEISKVFIGLVTTMTTSYRNQGVLLIRNSDIKNNRFEFSDSPIYLDKKFADENSSRKLMLGDVITVHTGDVGTSAVVTEKEEGSIGFATIVSRPNKNIVDSNYLSVFFNTDIHKNFAMNVSTGDGRANYNLKDFYKLKVPLPAIDEQIKIGLLVQKLDALINQHQQQITKLNNIKQACLSKMFV
ncbi:restriction endonuclease subunit S [Frischella sp. Ac48]|uniref:Restriction endonuclease subunit S n=1 Tax=Frischella japonica TaxID=2741544 RepID=A0ABR7QZT7_9GAMM|nr:MULTISPECIES: restriction endonuclease subunit S [Frischella]MBC9131734.1 restriction endonuclease subunit S [Frischella japonica]MBX4134182.1 restriction endonuclease subunit S [Frischella sp. Ac48]